MVESGAYVTRFPSRSYLVADGQAEQRRRCSYIASFLFDSSCDRGGAIVIGFAPTPPTAAPLLNRSMRTRRRQRHPQHQQHHHHLQQTVPTTSPYFDTCTPCRRCPRRPVPRPPSGFTRIKTWYTPHRPVQREEDGALSHHGHGHREPGMGPPPHGA